jgi:hypothetical protein
VFSSSKWSIPLTFSTKILYVDILPPYVLHILPIPLLFIGSVNQFVLVRCDKINFIPVVNITCVRSNPSPKVGLKFSQENVEIILKNATVLFHFTS